MRTMRIIPLLLVVAAGCLGQETPAPPQNVIPGMAVDFVLKNEHPSLHEPLRADLSITNNGTSDVTIDLGANYVDNISGTITTPDGAKVEIRSPYEGGYAALGKATIRGRDSWARMYLLNEWNAFAAPGRYEVALHIPTLPDPAPLVFTVAPRDEKKLEAVLAELEADATQLRNAQRRADGARALALTNDPLVVPHLVRILKGRDDSSAYRAAEGLARIADKASIEALLAAAETGEGERRQVAASQLRLARPRINDRALLKRIDAILNPAPSPH